MPTAKRKKKIPKLKLLLVPRHPHRFNEVAQLLNTQELRFARRSELLTPLANGAPIVLIGQCGGTLGMVGNGRYRVRRGKPGQPGRAKHD